MKRLQKIDRVRKKLADGHASIGSWMQIPSSDVGEIMGQAGYDWVAVDLEHGTISIQQLPDIFRAIELGGTLPLARLSEGKPKYCKEALDAGAAGVIVPMVESKEQVEMIYQNSCWPPVGTRGVGYSRANLYGKNFSDYRKEASAPMLIAQIEHIRAVDNIDQILRSEGLDAVFVGPYDLSASMGLTGEVDHPDVASVLLSIVEQCKKTNIPAGIHIVQPNIGDLSKSIDIGYRFIAYSIDAVFLYSAANLPKAPFVN